MRWEVIFSMLVARTHPARANTEGAANVAAPLVVLNHAALVLVARVGIHALMA